MTARITKLSGPHDLLCKQLKLVGIQGFTREYRAIPGRRYRIDVAFPDQRLAVEVHGGSWVNGRHNRGAGMETDSEKISLLAGLGWRYVQVTSTQVRNGKALNWIEKALKAGEAGEATDKSTHHAEAVEGGQGIHRQALPGRDEKDERIEVGGEHWLFAI